VSEPTAPAPREGRRPRLVRNERLATLASLSIASIVALGGALLAGWLPRRMAHAQAVRRAAAEQAPRRLAVIETVAEGTGRDLTLPGGLIAAERTAIYARASGFVRRWLVDIGDHVHTGQVLAILDTPDLDQQLAQARATLAQTTATLAQMIASQQFAHLTADRQDTLVAQNLVAQQDADQARTQAAVSDATVRAAQANIVAQRDAVRQLEYMVSFGQVIAPFDGTITQRLTEIGSLVNAGAGTAAQALFEVEATDPVRVFVRVPQTFALSVRVDQPAYVVVRQHPGQRFAGKVTRTAGALDPASRTLTTEVMVPNQSGDLLVGMYAEVTLSATVAHRIVKVPSTAIVFDAKGVHVAGVDDGNHVHLLVVQPGRDDGSDVEIVDGLVGGERVLATPPADVLDGMLVQPIGG
jgi:RND family efflux transporter MFP subunit